MKKLFLSALAIAAMVSCSKTDSNDASSTEIKLSAAVNNVAVKAPIDAWADTPVSFAKGVAADTYTEAWGAKVLAGGAVALNPSQSYHATDTYFLKGYAPQGTLNGNVVTFTGMNGTQDILLSQELSGKKLVPFAAPFVFNHQLTQFNFKVMGSTGFMGDVPGATLTSIKVNGTALPVSMDLPTNAITYAGAVAPITAFSGTETISTVVTAVPFGAVMVEPGKTVQLAVTAGGVDYPTVPVTINGGGLPKAGTAYTVTITIKNAGEIMLSAEITPWVKETGSADIEKPAI